MTATEILMARAIIRMDTDYPGLSDALPNSDYLGGNVRDIFNNYYMDELSAYLNELAANGDIPLPVV